MFTGTVPQGAGHPTIASVAPEFSYLDDVVERMRQQDPGRRPANVEEIKKELIGRKNEFIRLQELDQKKRQVVPAAAPGQVEEVSITAVEWNDGTLAITLNRAPEAGLIERVRESMGSSRLQSISSRNLFLAGYAASRRIRTRLQRKPNGPQGNVLSRKVAVAEARARTSKTLKF
jgi:hypothetical protein